MIFKLLHLQLTKNKNIRLNVIINIQIEKFVFTLNKVLEIISINVINDIILSFMHACLYDFVWVQTHVGQFCEHKLGVVFCL